MARASRDPLRSGRNFDISHFPTRPCAPGSAGDDAESVRGGAALGSGHPRSVRASPSLVVGMLTASPSFAHGVAADELRATCNFAELMEKVQSVTDGSMAIADLQGDPAFQDCESAPSLRPRPVRALERAPCVSLNGPSSEQVPSRYRRAAAGQQVAQQVGQEVQIAASCGGHSGGDGGHDDPPHTTCDR